MLRSTASGSTATSGGSQATGDISQGAASSEWQPVYAECEGPIAGWSEMSNGEKLEHLGELACREQASRARDILRFVLKILCFLSMNILVFILSIISLSVSYYYLTIKLRNKSDVKF